MGALEMAIARAIDTPNVALWAGFYTCSDDDVEPHVELSRDNPCRPIDPIDGADCPGLAAEAPGHDEPD